MNMIDVEVIKRFPHGGSYHNPQTVVNLPKKKADLLVVIGKAKYCEEKEQVQDVLVSDKVKAFAEENDVDLSLVEGTGKKGRINSGDVQRVIDSRAPKAEEINEELDLETDEEAPETE